MDWTTIPHIVAMGYTTIQTPEDNSAVKEKVAIPEQPDNNYLVILSKENGLNHGLISGEAQSTATTYCTLHQWLAGEYIESWCRWAWIVIRKN